MTDALLPPDNWVDSDYLFHNPDVARAVESKQFKNGWQHYLGHGQAEGRRSGITVFAKTDQVTRHCFDPWCYLEITPAHGVKPCCNIMSIATWVPGTHSVEDLRNTEPFQLLRSSLLTGKLSGSCQNCHIRPLVSIEDFKVSLQKRYSSSFCDSELVAQPLRQLRLEVTTKCNLRCVYCPVSQPGYTSAEMAETSFAAIVDLVAKQSRDCEIILNGHGETTFHSSWLTLCNAIIELGFRPSIITNLARLLDDEEAECLAGFSVVQISLDTVDAELLRALRRHVKLSNVIENIRKIRAFAGKKIAPTFSISCGVYDANYPFLKDVAEFCISFDIHNVTFWQLVKYGDLPDAHNVYPILSLSPDRIADAIEQLLLAIQLLHQNGISTEVAGGMLEEWKNLVV